MICSMNAPGTCIFVDIDFAPHHHHQHTCAPGRAVFLRQGLPQIVWVYFQYRQPAGRPGCTATFMSRGRDKIRPVGATRRSPLHPRVPTNIPRPEPQPIVSTTTGIQSAITKRINGKINIGGQNSVWVQNFEPIPQRRRQNKYQKIIPTSIGAIARDVKPALQNRFAKISIVTPFPFGNAIIVDGDRWGDPTDRPTPVSR